MKGTVQFTERGLVRYALAGNARIGSEIRSNCSEGWNTHMTTGESPVLAFSLNPVHVQFAGSAPIILSPAIVAMTNSNSQFLRRPVTDSGQRSIIISFPTPILLELISTFYPAAAEDPMDPFPSRIAPSCPRALVMARQLERIAFHNTHTPNALALEECAIRILERSLDSIMSTQRTRATSGSYRTLRDHVNQTIVNVCNDPSYNWSLDELADAVDLSPAYLSRVFCSHTGLTITRFLATTRVSYAAERLHAARGRFTALAIESGFSSHAHMSAIFMKLLNTTPSALSKSSPAAFKDTIRSLDAMGTGSHD